MHIPANGYGSVEVEHHRLRHEELADTDNHVYHVAFRDRRRHARKRPADTHQAGQHRVRVETALDDDRRRLAFWRD